MSSYHFSRIIVLTAILQALLLHLTNCTIHYVTPDIDYDDDHYSAMNNNSILQQFVDHTNEYFISNTQFYILTGEHHLNSDIIIQNVDNLRITGIKTNGVINSTIKCVSAVGIAIANCRKVFLENLIISRCTSNFTSLFEKYVLEDIWKFYSVGLFVMNSWFVSVVDIHLLQGEESVTCGFQALNILGKSVINNTKTNCFEVYYTYLQDNVVNTKNELYIENYLSDTVTRRIDAITVLLSDASYDSRIILQKTSFSDIQPNAFNFYYSGFQGYGLIDIIDCSFKEIFGINDYELEVVNFVYKNCFNEFNSQPFKVNFKNCNFSNNLFLEEGKLLDVYVDIKSNNSWLTLYDNLKVFIINCSFHNNQNLQLISVIYSDTRIGRTAIPQVVIKHTTITNLRTMNILYGIVVDDAQLYFIGPVVLQHIFIHAKFESTPAIIKATDYFQLDNYVEFSECMAETAIFVEQLYLNEYSLINITNNTFGGFVYNEISFSTDPVSILMPMMLMPCIFQFLSKRGNLDHDIQTGKNLNYTILFKNNNIEVLSYYKYSTVHCGWNKNTAFLKSSPRLVNPKMIQYINDSLEDQTVTKYICFCDKPVRDDCYREELGPFYPGQTVDFYFIISFIPTLFEHILVKIEDGPEPACSTSNKSLLTELHRNECTRVKYTIQHKSGQECDLYLKAVPLHDLGHSISPKIALTEMYYVKLLPCPMGFTLLQPDGFCQCDPILLLATLITACDINDQTISRHPNSWITAFTINDSHSYNVSLQCPFDYCLPHHSQFNLLNPDSQCQFNRAGVLCGQCQHGLSTVFGSSECKQCTSVYLLIALPIGIAGIFLVWMLFLFNLTVTDGDVNVILFYVNIISINTSIFLPNQNIVEYAVISLTNLDLGITTCFYNGMDGYAKMWLQLVFPLYLIAIAIIFIIASRHSIRVLRLTSNRALPVLATLFLLSYTKVLRTVSNVLFLYPKITQLPSGHSLLVWAVDTSTPIFGAKFSILFCICLLLLLVLAIFNVVLLFTRTLSYFNIVNRFKPLLDAYQGPYKDMYYYWTGLQLVLRAVFFGLTALERNTNLMIGSLLIGTYACIQGTIYPLKDKMQNIQEVVLLLNLNSMFVVSLYSNANGTAATILITLASLQMIFIFLKHVRKYTFKRLCTKLEDKTKAFLAKCWVKKSANENSLGCTIPLVPDVTYNYKNFQEPLIGEDN